MMSEEFIRICRGHRDIETPLIWTFKFDGAEYWCPHCGHTAGMLGAGIEVPHTPELAKRLKQMKTKATPFLRDETEEWTYAG